MPGKNLTREEAAERAALIEVDSYEVDLDLTTGPQTFRSVSRVEFTSRQPGASTFIDLIAESAQKVTLNGVDLDPASFEDCRIPLPDLAEHNTLVVDATCLYTNSGEGVDRFVDPLDGQVYLYTQFEVPDSRRMYAVFEQPDLKATFQFTVTAPACWTVISNSPTPQPQSAQPGDRTVDEGEIATWRFEPTPPMSSYITAMCAGPYVGVKDSVQCRAGQIELGVYCRASLLPHLDADNIFDCTKKGFRFFEEEFDHPFPFAKYDQIFAPDYNMGAMENAGCVTIAEMYVFRSKVSDALVERRALTILHELAHMWFGDLVTMKWWDDLWLNESFAEWTSTTCQAEATHWTSAWTTFGIAEKGWAYTQDQLSSTHPIAADMRHLEDVEVNFDGITYAKGASVLKQLVAYVGREAFRESLREYFRLYAWKNTELNDLLELLEKHSGRDLGRWSQLWLQTAGVNTLVPEVEVSEGAYTSFAVRQVTPAQHPTQRPHRMGIGLYAVRDGRLVRTDYIEVDIDGERTELPELVGRRQPDLLLLNDEDLAYAKIRLDERSLATVLANPNAFDDTLAQSLVLLALWDMVKEAELSPHSYLDWVLSSMADVQDSNLLRSMLGSLTARSRRTSAAELGTLCYLPEEARDGAARQMADRFRALLSQAEPGSDRQLQLMQGLQAVATEEHLSWLADLYEERTRLDGLALDPEMRWGLLITLVSGGVLGADRIDAELERDPSSTGQERAAAARASLPTAQAKEAAWQAAVVDNALATQTLAAVGLGFLRGSAELLEPYVARFHDSVRQAWDSRSVALGERVVLHYYPMSLANRALLDVTDAWLAANADAPAGLLRGMAEHRDGIAACVAAQERFA